LQSFLPIVEQMVEEGLVVLSNADIIKYSYRALDMDTSEKPSETGNSSA